MKKEDKFNKGSNLKNTSIDASINYLQSIKNNLTKDDQEFVKVFTKMLSIRLNKNSDYGNSFSEGFVKMGSPYAIGRIWDKVCRLVNICTTKNILVKDESVEDTLIDCANYCIMTYIELNKLNKS
uniref:Nucleotide modification associated domain-containing protein n=1 Tax=Geladintestivirus 1 TaxID=3233133 RepID=A0AAU8MI52_9CAUD